MSERTQAIQTARRILLQQPVGVDLSQYSTEEILAIPLRTIKQLWGYKVTDEMLERSDYTPEQLVEWADGAVHYSTTPLLEKAVRDLDQLDARHTLIVLLHGSCGPTKESDDPETMQRDYQEARDRVKQRFSSLLEQCSRTKLIELMREAGSPDHRSVEQREVGGMVLPVLLQTKPSLDQLIVLAPVIDSITDGAEVSRVAFNTIEDQFAAAVGKLIQELTLDGCLALRQSAAPDAIRGNTNENHGTRVVRELLVKRIVDLWSQRPIEELLQLVAELGDQEIEECLFASCAQEEGFDERMQQLLKLTGINQLEEDDEDTTPVDSHQ